MLKKFSIIFSALLVMAFISTEAEAAKRGDFIRGKCPTGSVSLVIEGIPQCVKKEDHIKYLKEQEERWRKAYEEELAAIHGIEQEIQGVEKETDQTKTDLEASKSKRDEATRKKIELQADWAKKPDPIDLKTNTVGGLPLGSLKNGLDQAAGSLEGIRKTLKNMGWKDEDIQKLVDYVGVDPERLAKAVREVANTVKPEMDLRDLNILQTKLEGRLREVEADEEKIKNTAAKERAEVARYNEDIAKAKGEWDAANKSRQDHDGLADGYDAECKAKWETCVWNIPKAAYERSLAALDQANMNRIDAWIGLLNFGKMWPSMVVAGADLKAAPYTGMKQLIEKQLADVKTTRKDLKAKIELEWKKQQEEFAKAAGPLNDQFDAESKKVKELEKKLGELPPKREVLDGKKAEREKEAERLLLLVKEYQSELAKFGVTPPPITGQSPSSTTASRSIQSLSAPSQVWDQSIKQAENWLAEARKRTAVAGAKYKDEMERFKRDQDKKEEATRKPLPMKELPLFKGLETMKGWETELNALQKREFEAWTQYQKNMEAAKVAIEGDRARELEQFKQKLALQDKGVEEAKRKVQEAEGTMKKALAETEAKKKAEEAAKKKAEETPKIERPAIAPPPSSNPPELGLGKVSTRPALSQLPGQPGGPLVSGNPTQRSALAPPIGEEGGLKQFDEAVKSIMNLFQKQTPGSEIDPSESASLSQKEIQDGIRWFNEMQKKMPKAEAPKPAVQQTYQVEHGQARLVVPARQQVRATPKIRAAVQPETRPVVLPTTQPSPPRQQNPGGGLGDFLNALAGLAGELQTQPQTSGTTASPSWVNEHWVDEQAEAPSVVYRYEEPAPTYQEEPAIDTSWQSPQSDESWESPGTEHESVQSDGSWVSPESDGSWQGYEE